MASIHYVNDDGEDVYLDMRGKTIEQIDSLASKVKKSLSHANVDVDYDGVEL